MPLNISKDDLKKLEDAARESLKELGVDVEGQITQPFAEWSIEVAPQIARYAALAAAGEKEAKSNLEIIRTIAVAKASRFIVIGQRLTSDRLGDIAVFAAKLLAKVIL